MLQKIYWVVPLFSAIVWFGTILAMLLWWVINNEPHLSSESANQGIAYISDVGSHILKPLFIAGGTTAVVTLDISMIIERWARHTGDLAPNTSWWQKGFSIIAIIASIAGALGLILLTIFDNLRHDYLHVRFLVLFIVGYLVSAIFICAEFQRLGIKYRQHRVLRASFWIKLTFIIVEIALAIGFGVLNLQQYRNYNAAAILEWCLAFIFTGYILSFFMDLLPAVKSKHHHSQEPMTEMGFEPNGQPHTNGDYISGPPLSNAGRSSNF